MSAVANRGTAVISVLAARVVTGVVLVAVILAALFLLPPAGFGAVALLIVVAGADEWAKLIAFTGARRRLFSCMALLTGALLVWAALDRPGWAVAAICGLAALFWIAVGIPSVVWRWQPPSSWARAASGGIVLAGALVAIVSLQQRSPWLALAAMASVWIADTAAYFAGRRFGRRKLAPQISPGKTWEGAWGGIAAVAVYAVALLPLAAPAGFTARPGAVAVVLWVLFAGALAALSIVGDLHESLLKRNAGVKDSGTLLPGHGGVLDRIDALLAALPVVALAALALGPRP